jgi:hypothetical protein
MIVFVSFEPGAFGHRLARTLCTLPQFYWYSDARNGVNPWNVYFKSTEILQRSISPYHFDRITPGGMLPPTHDYVRDFVPDANVYYNTHFKKQWQAVGADDIEQDIIYCTHSSPQDLLTYFPDSKIINIVLNPTVVTRRYMETTAVFPGWIKADWIGGRDTEYGKRLRIIGGELGKKFKIRDIWAWENYGTEYYSDYYSEYFDWIFKNIQTNTAERIDIDDPRVLSLSTRNYKLIKGFLNG